MVISHLYKFIYLPIPKTASRAIRTALKPYGAETVAYGECSESMAVHQLVTPPEFSGYTTFASVRNPFRRALSIYLYNQQVPKNQFHQESCRHNFADFLLLFWEAVGCQASMLSGLRVDHHVYWEMDIPKQLKKILPFVHSIVLPTRNAVKYVKPWQDYYSPEAIQTVLTMAAKDFEQFNYGRSLEQAGELLR